MSLSTAGTKDKRAITCQKATAYRVEREKLAALNEKLIQMKIGDFEYCDKQLKLGDLSGNRFTIVLRNIEGIGDDQIKLYVENFMRTGFINYYGLQRFGTLTVPTYDIGKSVLKKNWFEAVDLILIGLDEALSVWAKTKDAAEACKFLPKSQNQIEGSLLLSLKKHQPTKNYAAAFNSIPRNIRNLYLHSVQSLLWNKLASKRVEKYGTQVLDGDFYVQNDRCAEYQIVDSNSKEQVEHFQIVIPFFASPDHLPKNEMSQWYDELLNEEGITWDQLQQGSKEYALHGGFRKLFVKINNDNNFSYEILRYDDFNQILTSTDLDILNGKTLSLKNSDSCKYKGLKIEFNLPSSSYATMALRELTKCDFSKQNQTNLTKKLAENENSKNEDQISPATDDDADEVDC
uniref:TRUD domain-containing protein n=1 Tax=Romanomermis culicivorax TaxID=13658 RepID=A0A915JK45_ROMCU